MPFLPSFFSLQSGLSIGSVLDRFQTWCCAWVGEDLSAASRLTLPFLEPEEAQQLDILFGEISPHAFATHGKPFQRR